MPSLGPFTAMNLQRPKTIASPSFEVLTLIERIARATRIDSGNETFLSWHDMKQLATDALLKLGYTEEKEPEPEQTKKPESET